MEKILRQVKKAQERREQKVRVKLIKKLQMSNFTYLADNKNMTFSIMAQQLVDCMNMINLPKLLKEHIHIEKRKNLYNRFN